MNDAEKSDSSVSNDENDIGRDAILDIEGDKTEPEEESNSQQNEKVAPEMSESTTPNNDAIETENDVEGVIEGTEDHSEQKDDELPLEEPESTIADNDDAETEDESGSAIEDTEDRDEQKDDELPLEEPESTIADNDDAETEDKSDSAIVDTEDRDEQKDDNLEKDDRSADKNQEAESDDKTSATERSITDTSHILDAIENDGEQQKSFHQERNKTSYEPQGNTTYVGKKISKKISTKILVLGAAIGTLLLLAIVCFIVKPTFITSRFSEPELTINTPKTVATQLTAEEMEMIGIIGQALDETEQVWEKIFSEKGGIFKNPEFTFFTDKINWACLNEKDKERLGEQSSIGTFYCPREKKIYIDLSLHLDLNNRLDIPIKFAQAYIVAHEIGHHVQNLAGISNQIPAARLRLSDKEFGLVWQRLELQADCFAGIWAKQFAEQQYNISEDDFQDALDAVSHYATAHAKQKSKGDLMPDPFTHGSSRLRLRWFTIGYEKGTFDACDTFTIVDL